MMMDQNRRSKSASTAPLRVVDDPLPTDQYDHQCNGRPHSPRKLTRHRSSDSCYSSQSCVSNATGSSTRTHRRCKIELSSFLLSPGSEHTTKPVDTNRKPRTTDARVSRQVSAETSHSIDTSERRGPNSDHFATESNSSRVCVSPLNLDAFGSGGKAIDVHHPGFNAVELIRELSFETISPHTQRVSAPDKNKAPPSYTPPSYVEEPTYSFPDKFRFEPNEISDDGSVVLDETAQVEKVGRELPPRAPSPPQATSGATSSPSSPPLPPKINRLSSNLMNDLPPQVLHNRSRTRSTSISEMSDSYFQEFVLDAKEDKSSTHGSLSHSSISSKDAEPMADSERKSLITIDHCEGSPQRDTRHPASLCHHARTSTVGSEVSSFLSSSSSEFDELSIDSQSQGEDVKDILVVDLEESLFNQETGHSSLQEGKCNTYHCDSSAECTDPNVHRPRLDSDALRKWNTICEKEYSKKGITKGQLLFRVLSCPNKMNAETLSPDRSSVFRRDRQETEDESFEMPRIMSGLSQVMGSLFSYTNSCADSTIPSQKKELDGVLDEVISDLDFDMGIMHSFSLGKSSVSTPRDDADRLSKNHRRSLSSGSGLRIPASLSNIFLHQLEDGSAVSKTCSSKRHRRYKSDGLILCKKQQTSLSQTEFSFSDALSFKNKTNIRRHNRGTSLCSFQEPFDCSPLQCILEETSKGSGGADNCIALDLMGFLNQYIESLRTRSVMELGFVFGLLVGLLIPYVLNAVTASIVS